jgi:hypothetical protein
LGRGWNGHRIDEIVQAIDLYG